jgi:hypothetical protein
MHTPGPGLPTQSVSVEHFAQVNDCATHTGVPALAQSVLETHSTQAPLGPQTGVSVWSIAHD